MITVTLYKCFVFTTKSTRSYTRMYTKCSRKREGSCEPKGRVRHEGTRTDQPARSDTLGPQWMAPLRSKPRNLNMQIHRIKTYNIKETRAKWLRDMSK